MNTEAHFSQSMINNLVQKALIMAEQLGFGYEPVATTTADAALFPLPISIGKLRNKFPNPQQPLLTPNPWR